ncbi:MAG TPA: hypothetical protein PKI76_07360 [Oscillospiraceae bacterium]|nr:hypothetical protein [Oscillospiraceae bacterium]HNW05180.1 hypothetical protein [Oscillospiraceae bacterium]
MEKTDAGIFLPARFSAKERSFFFYIGFWNPNLRVFGPLARPETSGFFPPFFTKITKNAQNRGLPVLSV